eukprot:CAMPEP_0114493138 /NCGR_PEP_ID=MMETSP0109-20121206/3944_1 /TAXON_ID=29199 /ORGANISM="Chlorarachnion reptans, Strain CCCM449" /LENGTH=411 /DNA_ID=CAMNT_0001670059 /DNA_START=148 /DNA_END=1383 /DNA_ORIENTATION=-
MAPMSPEKVLARARLLELAAKHSRPMTYNRTVYRGKGAPKPYGIPEIPTRIAIPRLLGIFVQNWLRTNVEIELRLGVLIDKAIEEKAKLKPRRKSILLRPPLVPRTRFDPGVKPKMFAAINNEINSWVRNRTLSAKYNRTLEVDAVYVVKNSNVGTSQHLRYIFDPHTGKIKDKMVKQRLQNLDLYWPGEDELDLRVTASMEVRNPVGMVPNESCERLRKKNRITYQMPHFKVDLSETYTYLFPDEKALEQLKKPRPKTWEQGMKVRLFVAGEGWQSGCIKSAFKSTVNIKLDQTDVLVSVHRDSMALEKYDDNDVNLKPEVTYEVEAEITSPQLTVMSLQAWYQCIRSLKHVAEITVNPNIKPTADDEGFIEPEEDVEGKPIDAYGKESNSDVAPDNFASEGEEFVSDSE